MSQRNKNKSGNNQPQVAVNLGVTPLSNDSAVVAPVKPVKQPDKNVSDVKATNSVVGNTIKTSDIDAILKGFNTDLIELMMNEFISEVDSKYVNQLFQYCMFCCLNGPIGFEREMVFYSDQGYKRASLRDFYPVGTLTHAFINSICLKLKEKFDGTTQVANCVMVVKTGSLWPNPKFVPKDE